MLCKQRKKRNGSESTGKIGKKTTKKEKMPNNINNKCSVFRLKQKLNTDQKTYKNVK